MAGPETGSGMARNRWRPAGQGRQILAGPGTGSDARKSIAHFRHAGHTAIAVCCSDHFFVNIRNLGINLLAIRTMRTALFRQIQCESRPCTAFQCCRLDSPIFWKSFLCDPLDFPCDFFRCNHLDFLCDFYHLDFLCDVFRCDHLVSFGAIMWIFYVMSFGAIICIFHVMSFGADVFRCDHLDFHVIAFCAIIWISHVMSFGAIIQ
jgi:hypothetical protein